MQKRTSAAVDLTHAREITANGPLHAALFSSRKSCGWGLLLRRNRLIDLKVGLCTSGGFAQYLPPFDSDSVRD